MRTITSISNPLIKRYAKLKIKKHRDRENMFIIEGHHMVEEAKKMNIVIDVFSTKEKFGGILINDIIMNKLSDAKTPQSVIAICKKQEGKISGNRVLALDNIQDPGNLGTLIRTAKAFGWDTVITSGADIYNPKVLRATQGSIFSINVIHTEDIAKYFSGYKIIGAMLDEAANNYKSVDLPEKIILVLGNEGKGISLEVQSKLDQKIYIPIKFESLNVAQAGAILMNEYSQ